MKKRNYSRENEVEYRNKKKITIKLDKEIEKKFREKLDEDGDNMSNFIRKKIDEYLK